ncbi:hypothetical protein [Anditalea andensis]|nr:hypothetical protein [Anditalea andensis]
MDYIEGTMGRWYTFDMDRKLIYSLVDLHLSVKEFKKPFKTHFLSFLRRPFWNTIRLIATIVLNKLGFKDMVKCLYLCLKLSFKVKTNMSPILLHKDINNMGNIVTDKNGELYFLDFESCIIEYKWIFTDIIEVIYSYKDEYLDVELFKVFVNEMQERNFINKGFDLKSQIRFAMLKNVIKYIGFKDLYVSHKNTLLNNILPDDKFDIWYEDTFGKITVAI